MSTRMTEWCGSPPYAAPEIFTGQPYYGPEIDVWSMGIVLYALVTGALPFQASNFDDLTSMVVNGVFNVPFYLSEACVDLLHKMICVDPVKRISLADMQRHPWANGADSMSLHRSASTHCDAKDTPTASGADVPSRPDQRSGAKHSATALTSNRTPEAVTVSSNCTSIVANAPDDVPRRKLFDAPSIPNITTLTDQEPSTPKTQPLMLFACNACGIENSARWDFTLRTPDVCLRYMFVQSKTFSSCSVAGVDPVCPSISKVECAYFCSRTVSFFPNQSGVGQTRP